MICVTERGSDKRVWINPKHIAAIEPEEWGTTIALGSKTGYQVLETADDIMDLLTEYYEVWP
jgi:hypothetical protein